MMKHDVHRALNKAGVSTEPRGVGQVSVARGSRPDHLRVTVFRDHDIDYVRDVLALNGFTVKAGPVGPWLLVVSR